MSRDRFREAPTMALPSGNKANVLIMADKDVAVDNVVFAIDLAKQLKVEKLVCQSFLEHRVDDTIVGSIKRDSRCFDWAGIVGALDETQ